MFHTAGGLTPKFQILDCAPNGIVHQHVTEQNMLRMLTAKKDSRGYPVCMNRVELAHSVAAGWKKVSPRLIMQCAFKCGVAQLSDLSENVIERESLRSVRIDPIISDLVCSSAAQFVFPTMQEDIDPVLYELGSIFQLDPELSEELDELEFIRSGIDDCARAREAAREGLNQDELDIDHNVPVATIPIELEVPAAEEVSQPEAPVKR